MKPPNARLIKRILETLNWNGHVELGNNDLDWLASELAVALNPKRDSELCEVCEEIKPIVVKTDLGRICSDCLEEFTDESDEQKAVLEED